MSEPVVCPSCGVILSRGPEDPATAPASARSALGSGESARPTIASNSADGLDPISVSLASEQPDPILRSGETPVPIPDPEEIHERRGASWPIVLLGSYASALTLACGWLVWERQSGHEREKHDPIAVDTRPDPGLRADRSRRIAAAPIPDAQRTTLGKPIRVGSLEVTPLETRSGRVTLEHMGHGGDGKRRDGGSKALRLRLRLRNLSTDAIFTPLDEAFLRENERGEPESYIMSGTGEKVPLYPLAVQSEWSIVGQEFRELKPGEALETWIVSAADEALDHAKPPLTWSLRLRTGIDRTDMVGVRIGDEPSRPTKTQDRRPGP